MLVAPIMCTGRPGSAGRWPMRWTSRRRRQAQVSNGRRVAAQQQRQHRHEVALAAAEAAVQVRALAGIRSDRAADQRQRIIEATRELRGHHVVAQRLPGPLHPLREPQHEITLMDALGEIEDVGDGGHGLGAPVEDGATAKRKLTGNGLSNATMPLGVARRSPHGTGAHRLRLPRPGALYTGSDAALRCPHPHDTMRACPKTPPASSCSPIPG